MNINYSFLNDELALIEIRKHKWIESEKLGYEIGFATAAIDWIKKHGEQFKNYRLGMQSQQNIFSEKRRFRRFDYQLPLTLKTGESSIATYTNDINLIGLTCVLPYPIPENSQTEVTIHFATSTSKRKAKMFQFQSTVKRVSEAGEKASRLCHKVFLPFTEDVRHYLLHNVDLINH